MKIIEKIELDAKISVAIKKFLQDEMTEADPYIEGRIIANSIILAIRNISYFNRNESAKVVQGICDTLKDVRF